MVPAMPFDIAHVQETQVKAKGPMGVSQRDQKVSNPLILLAQAGP